MTIEGTRKKASDWGASLVSVSSRKHQYSSGRFQYILDSNLITTIHLLQLFLCQLLILLDVLFILFHNLINFKLLNLLFLVSQMSFVLIDIAKIRKFLADSKKNAKYLSELLRQAWCFATK